jgi:hypothetical protein
MAARRIGGGQETENPLVKLYVGKNQEPADHGNGEHATYPIEP